MKYKRCSKVPSVVPVINFKLHCSIVDFLFDLSCACVCHCWSFSLICSYVVHYVSPLTSMVDKYYHVPFNKSSEPCSNKGKFVFFTAINYLRGPFREDRFTFERFKRQSEVSLTFSAGGQLLFSTGQNY